MVSPGTRMPVLSTAMNSSMALPHVPPVPTRALSAYALEALQ
jgi:hypothetical protein